MDFGLGSANITVTDYLSERVLPALDFSLTRLIEHIVKTKEINKWKDAKEEEYHRLRREAKKKEKKDAGESVSGSEEWEDSENSEEKIEMQPPFDPILFIADMLEQYKNT